MDGLLVLQNLTGSHRISFLEQIKKEASLIISIMLKIILDSSKELKSNKSWTQVELQYIHGTLKLFNILPLADNNIKALVMQKNIIPFLAEMRKVYLGYNHNSTLGKNITETLKKMDKICDAYHQAIIIVEQQPNASVPQISSLKTYYLSQIGRFNMFNAANRVFDNRYGEHHTGFVIRLLKERAQKNPGGASEKTLQHFGLK